MNPALWLLSMTIVAALGPAGAPFGATGGDAVTPADVADGLAPPQIAELPGPDTGTTDTAATVPVDQEAVPTEGGFLSGLVAGVSGTGSLSAELYHAGRIEPRRPAALYRMNSGVRTRFFGGMSVNVNLIWSDEGVDFRQNVSQLGLNPTWDWGGLYLGDFTLDYSRYVMQGSRVRGGGVMYDPGAYRASFQAGRLEREESLGADDHISYNRTAAALRAGIGPLQGTHVNLTLFRGWDAVADGGLDRPDTLFLDTIPEDLRAEFQDRPQENWALGLDGQLLLLDDRLSFEGEVSASLLTRDREAPAVSGSGSDAVPGDGLDGAVGELADIRISSALDYAFEGAIEYRLPFGSVRGGYEYVGPGYGSLGVPYLLNDRRSWEMGARLQLLRGRLAVQGRYMNQANNLTSQRRNTVDRNTVQLAVTARPLRAVSLNVAGVFNTMRNDATDDWDRLDNTALALNTGASWRHRLFGLRSSLGIEYGYQETESRDTWIGASRVWTHQVSGSYRVRVGRAFSIAPKVSLVNTQGTGVEERQNTRLGFNGSGRFFDGRLRTSLSVSNTTSSGRDAFGVRGKASYPVFWGTELSFQVRHQRYTAFGRRPAFDESFFTFALTRSF